LKTPEGKDQKGNQQEHKYELSGKNEEI